MSNTFTGATYTIESSLGGLPTLTSQVIGLGAPPAPANLFISATTTSSLQVSWSFSGDNASVQGFYVQHGITASNFITTSFASGGTARNKILTPLVTGTQYFIQVKANGNGLGGYSGLSDASNQASGSTS